MIRYSLYAAAFILCVSCGPDKTKESAVAAIDSMTIHEVVGIANVEPLQRILSITPETNGIIKKINIEINQKVKKGDVLFVLDNEVEASQVEQAKSKLATQQAVISRKQTEIESAENTVRNSKINFERSKNLFESNAITKKQFDDDKVSYENQSLQVEALKKDLQQNQRRLIELQADVHYFQTLLDRKIVTAPLDGTILSVDTKLGSNVSNTTSMCDFAPDGPLMAITEIDELFARNIKIGQLAIIRPQGDTVILARGKVILAAPYLRKKSLFSDKADNLEDRRVREVRVQLEPSDSLLIGSRVECIIDVR